MYNLYVIYYDKDSNLDLIFGKENVKRIVTNGDNSISMYYINGMETISFDKILKVELIDQTLDDKEYEQERG